MKTNEKLKKKISSLLIICALFLLAGCSTGESETTPVITGTPSTGSQTTPTSAESPTTKAEPDSTTIMKKFEALLTSKISTPKDVARFIGGNIGDISAKDASKMILKFEEMQNEYRPVLDKKFYIGVIQSKFQQEDNFDIDLSKPENFEDADLRALIQETIDNGYKVERVEGSYFPVIDYSFYATFSTFAAEDIKEYLAIMTQESDKPSAKDGGLIIGWDEVIDRALRQESFIETYSYSERLTQVTKLYDRYVYFTFFGLPNTPLFDYETNVFMDYIRAAYEEAVTSNNDSLYIEDIHGFLEALSKNGYKLTEEVEKYINNINVTLSGKEHA